jgi:DNA-binding NarL/FixJ family response regulator
MEKLSVIISDNQILTYLAITTILREYYNDNITFKAAKTKDELINLLQTNEHDLLILDYDLIDFDEVSEIESIRNNFPSIGILVVTANQNPEYIIKVLDAGITDYILKTCDEDELIEAFKSTLEGRKYFSSKVLDVLLHKNSNVRNRKESGKLTFSEIEIVRLITQGLTTKEIASQKNLSFHTIITHRKNIFRKLDITNTSELHMYAIRNGIIDTTEYYI